MDSFELTEDALVRNGYLFKEVAALFSTEAFADWWAKKKSAFAKSDYSLKSRGAYQSYPKDSRSRRILTFPNPQHYVHLAQGIEKHWSEIRTYSESSQISISRLRKPETTRALGYFQHPRVLLKTRITRRVSKRNFLHVDISRFFPSVYLHRLETIFPGTNTSGHNNGLGSKLDNLSRRMQGNESVGLPLGPDTSFVLAEVFATYIDRRLPDKISAIRHVDDLSIYAESSAVLEKCLAAIHGACEDLRLELNNLKTYQGEVPDSLEPDWLAQLRPLASSIKSTDSLITFFNRSFALHTQTNDNRLLNYAIAASTAFGLGKNNWSIFEALLLTCLPTEPRSASRIGRVLLRAQGLGRISDSKSIFAVYRSFIRQHANRNHGFEVNRGVWTLYELNLAKKLTSKDWEIIAKMRDNFVAVTALWLRDQGYNLPKKLPIWNELVTCQNAYESENWLLCHECNLRGWIKEAASPSSGFWNAALTDEISFIDPFGGLFSNDETNNESAEEELDSTLENLATTFTYG